ncbi:hypothetical protein PIB30_103099, partial [Stylosanthes scabra]|nr:hypothetical protein [Stylosanthes scabra]
HAYAWKASFFPTFSRPRTCVEQDICVEEEFKPSLSYEDPRIGVEVHAYAWTMQQHSKEQQVPRICVESYA